MTGKTYDGYLGKKYGVAMTACAKCGSQFDIKSMIEVFGGRGTFGNGGGSPISQDWCLGCWTARGSKPAAETHERPAPVHPLACLAATVHKTAEDARARAEKVAFHLGKRPEITPLDQNDPGPFYCVGDSPLVPGFDKIKCANPYA